MLENFDSRSILDESPKADFALLNEWLDTCKYKNSVAEERKIRKQDTTQHWRIKEEFAGKKGIWAKKMAPALGFEPRTKWLTATYSTAELCRNNKMAEREGFEPSERFPPRRFSKPVLSATQPSLRLADAIRYHPKLDFSSHFFDFIAKKSLFFSFFCNSWRSITKYR